MFSFDKSSFSIYPDNCFPTVSLSSDYAFFLVVVVFLVSFSGSLPVVVVIVVVV